MKVEVKLEVMYMIEVQQDRDKVNGVNYWPLWRVEGGRWHRRLDLRVEWVSKES